MRHRIAFRLALSYLAVTLAFALVIGSVFVLLFRASVMEARKAEMLAQAAAVADSLQRGDSGGPGARRGMGPDGFGGTLQLLDDVIGGHAWLVDEELRQVTTGRGMRQVTYEALPADAEAVVQKVYAGETVFSENFSTLLSAPTLTLGYPVRQNGQVAGALLLHTSVESIRTAAAQGGTLLAYSLMAALLLSALLALPVARRLVRPLQQMQQTAARLSEGDYSARTGVERQDEIGDLARTIDSLSLRLQEAREEGERQEQQRRAFIANISHELRTPVTVIRGSLEALRDEVVQGEDEQRNYLHQMLAESRQLDTLLKDLLELSKLQSVDYRLEKAELNLPEVVADAVRSGRQLALPRDIDVQLRLPEEPLAYTGDYSRLKQMVLILLHNAIKFSPEHSAVEVRLDGRSLYVEDRGPGIPQEELPHLFERFARARRQDQEGSGLGLAILKEIADRHGIRVELLPREGGGTTARLDF